MMKKSTRKILCGAFLAVCAAALFAGSACAADQASAGGAETFQSLMATTDWLKANLDKVVLIDARDQSLYKGQQGHLPGAVNAGWTYFASMAGKAGDPKWGDVPDAAALAQKIGALGIDGKKEVVVYGDGGDWGNAGWVVWILRMTGMKNARMLDGGFTVWRATGGKTSSTTTTNKALKYPNAKIDPSYIVTTEWLAENVNNPEVGIVDVRSSKEYTGEIRPFGELRPGHIPGAVNIDMGEVFTPDYTLKPVAELEALFAQAGFGDKEKEIVLYDTAGVRSAFMTMVFRLAGYANARNYDSSYHAWCGNQALEIRQGPNP
jgi:3-mercaptopyruvate sulfurtransferase SseA